MNWDRLFELRAQAQHQDLRNRDLTNRCKCGNLLTIVDRGGVCRECRKAR